MYKNKQMKTLETGALIWLCEAFTPHPAVKIIQFFSSVVQIWPTMRTALQTEIIVLQAMLSWMQIISTYRLNSCLIYRQTDQWFTTILSNILYIYMIITFFVLLELALRDMAYNYSASETDFLIICQILIITVLKHRLCCKKLKPRVRKTHSQKKQNKIITAIQNTGNCCELSH